MMWWWRESVAISCGAMPMLNFLFLYAWLPNQFGNKPCRVLCLRTLPEVKNTWMVGPAVVRSSFFFSRVISGTSCFVWAGVCCLCSPLFFQMRCEFPYHVLAVGLPLQNILRYRS